MTGIERRGWGFPALARKAHYFAQEAGKAFTSSLCGSWAFGGYLSDDKHNHPDNCKRCMKKRERLAKRESEVA